MLPITELAKAKVNLNLHILGRRLDGYHELSSSVAFVDVADVLTIEPAQVNALKVSGRFADDVPLDVSNSIWKAYSWLARRVALPPVQVSLKKSLPVASGIGGGSADAAAMLRALLRLTGTSLDDEEVTALAIDLGADVPVCFLGKPCLMEGIGEKISALTIELPQALVLTNPLLRCSTFSVFTGMGLKAGQRHKGGANLWRNDMTKAAMKVQPAIGEVLAAFAETKLKPSLMSGSGATCFGVAQSLNEAQVEAQKIKALHPNWWVRAARIVT